MEPRIRQWLYWLEHNRRLRTATVDAYRTTMTAFDAYVGGLGNLDHITAHEIEAFMQRPRRKSSQPAPATQDRDRVCISNFYKWAVAHGEATINPTIDVGVPKVRNRVPRAVSDDNWARLWNSDIPDEDRVWLGLCCFAGLRRREIVSLAPEQVDTDRGLLLYLQRKGGNEDAVEYEQMARLVATGLPRLLPDVEEWLAMVRMQKLIRTGERCLITMDAPTTLKNLRWASFDDPRLPAPDVINDRLDHLLKRAGLPEKSFTPHALRHTCVTNLLRVGVPIEVVSDAVGHSAIDTTRRYVKSAGRLREWRERLES